MSAPDAIRRLSKALKSTGTNQDFLRANFGDDIAASYGKRLTLRTVRKTVAGRGVDTIIIGLPARADKRPQALPAFGQLPDEDISNVAGGTGDKMKSHLRG